MVALSLKHRVKMEKQATLLSEETAMGHRRSLLVVLSLIAAGNVLFAIGGAVLAGIVDYTYVNYDYDHRNTDWYMNDDVTVPHRVIIAFFYCSVPVVLSIVSVYELLRFNRKGSLHPTEMLISSVTGMLLWTIQLALESTCTWQMGGFDHCPLAFEGWQPVSVWGTGILAAWISPWLIFAFIFVYIAYIALAALVLRGSRKSTSSAHNLDRSYPYDHVQLELQTDRDMPEPAVAERGFDRPPRYRSETSYYESFPVEKEREVV